MIVPVEFTSSESIVRGYFFPSVTNAVTATVIFLHGFPGADGDNLVCERMAHESVNVLSFNYRGTHRSEGFFSFSNSFSDIGAALRFVKESPSRKEFQINPEKLVLGGWSFGGGIVPIGACQHPEFTRIFAIAGTNFGKEARECERNPEYAKKVIQNLESIRAPNGPVRFRDDLLSDLIENRDTCDLEKLAPSLKDRDMLLIGGWNDSIVPIEDHILPFYRSLMKNHANKVRLEAIQDGHEFSDSKDQLVQIILDWLREE